MSEPNLGRRLIEAKQAAEAMEAKLQEAIARMNQLEAREQARADEHAKKLEALLDEAIAKANDWRGRAERLEQIASGLHADLEAAKERTEDYKRLVEQRDEIINGLDADLAAARAEIERLKANHEALWLAKDFTAWWTGKSLQKHERADLEKLVDTQAQLANTRMQLIQVQLKYDKLVKAFREKGAR